MPPCDTSCSDAMEGGSSVDNGRVVHNINQAITMVRPCSSTEEEEAVSTNTSPTPSRTDQILTNHKDEMRDYIHTYFLVYNVSSNEAKYADQKLKTILVRIAR